MHNLTARKYSAGGGWLCDDCGSSEVSLRAGLDTLAACLAGVADNQIRGQQGLRAVRPRCPPRLLDVDAAAASGRYTREQLLDLAANADLGFDRLLFADALSALPQITDAAFAEYRAPTPP